LAASTIVVEREKGNNLESCNLQCAAPSGRVSSRSETRAGCSFGLGRGRPRAGSAETVRVRVPYCNRAAIRDAQRLAISDFRAVLPFLTGDWS
jgi:hypothetical protein